MPGLRWNRIRNRRWRGLYCSYSRYHTVFIIQKANIWLSLSFKYMSEIDESTIVDIESKIDAIDSKTDDLASLISHILDMFVQAL